MTVTKNTRILNFKNHSISSFVHLYYIMLSFLKKKTFYFMVHHCSYQSQKKKKKEVPTCFWAGLPLKTCEDTTATKSVNTPSQKQNQALHPPTLSTSSKPKKKEETPAKKDILVFSFKKKHVRQDLKQNACSHPLSQNQIMEFFFFLPHVEAKPRSLTS